MALVAVVVVFSMLSFSYIFRHAAETGRASMAMFRGVAEWLGHGPRVWPCPRARGAYRNL